MSLRPKKRSITLNGHNTSVTLEDRFWREFCYIATVKNVPINTLASEIDSARDFNCGLASAIRDFVLRYHIDKDKL